MAEKKSPKRGKSVVDEILEDDYADPTLKAIAKQARAIATLRRQEGAPERGVSPGAEKDDGKEVITHSEDYSTVEKQGQEYKLTPPQAQVIKLLDEEYQRKGKSGMFSKKYLLDNVKGVYANRVQEIFRTNREAFNVLVQCIGKPRGHYRLKC